MTTTRQATAAAFSTTEEHYVVNELVITLRDHLVNPNKEAQVELTKAILDLTGVAGEIKSVNGRYVTIKLTNSLSTTDLELVIARLRLLPEIDLIEKVPATYRKTAFSNTFNDPAWNRLFHYLSGLNFQLPPSSGIRYDSQVDDLIADYGPLTKDVVVAVIDTGHLNVPDLAGQILLEKNFLERDANSNPTDSAIDSGNCPSHGTSMVGIVAGKTNNGLGTTGILSEGKVISIRALDCAGGSSSDVFDAVNWLATPASQGGPAIKPQAINISLGSPGTSCPAFFQDAIDRATVAGISVFAAAGNGFRNDGTDSPANCDNVIAVGSVGVDNIFANYSNVGPELDISSFGGENDTPMPILDNVGNVAFSQGTSNSTPIVASVAAIAKKLNPGLTNFDILDLMQDTALKKSAINTYDPRCTNSLQSNCFSLRALDFLDRISDEIKTVEDGFARFFASVGTFEFNRICSITIDEMGQTSGASVSLNFVSADCTSTNQTQTSPQNTGDSQRVEIKAPIAQGQQDVKTFSVAINGFPSATSTEKTDATKEITITESGVTIANPTPVVEPTPESPPNQPISAAPSSGGGGGAYGLVGLILLLTSLTLNKYRPKFPCRVNS